MPVSARPEPGRVDLLPTPHGRGALGLVRCPGTGPGLGIDADLAAIVAVGTTMLVTLLAEDELARLRAATLPGACRARGLAWAHCPIPDMEPPGAAFERAWSEAGPQVHARLDAGEIVTLHCRAGLGRTGTIAARVLCERGSDAEAAIRRVRECRPGTIETPAQERYLLAGEFPVRARSEPR
ncbi:MAG: protein-tyrosine phosphatase family protein [Burkholderiales bacterium]